MKRALLALATTAAVTGLVIAWLAVNDTPSKEVAAKADSDWSDNCGGGLLSEVSYNVDPEDGRFATAQDAAKDALSREVRDDRYDKVEKRDEKTKERAQQQSGPGEYAAKKGAKLIAVVHVDQLENGKFAAGGISACAKDKKQFAPSSP
jgi:hypothetical protein